MVKRILGILVAVFTVVVIVLAILGRNDFRSLIELQGHPSDSCAEAAEQLPAERTDSTAGSDFGPLQEN